MLTPVTGFTCGAWDLLHPGHLALLNYANQDSDQLIVGLHTDPSIERESKNKPIQSSFERYYQLASLSFIDQIIPYDTEQDLLNMLAILNCPNMKRFVGDDYNGRDFTGKQLCKDLGIEIVYLTRDHNFSSTELRKRIGAASGDSAKICYKKPDCY